VVEEVISDSEEEGSVIGTGEGSGDESDEDGEGPVEENPPVFKKPKVRSHV
jgi:hypothetical protein